MWQVVVAAAVAGSGLLAKNLFTAPNHDSATTTSDQTRKTDHHNLQLEVHNFISNLAPESPTPPHDTCNDQNFMHDEEQKESIFRFSSSGSREGTRSRSGLKGLRRKKSGIGVRGSSGNAETRKDEKSTFVSLKKKRVAKIFSVKCAPPSSNDSSVFGWGVGVGIMYMMSAGKVEMSKLNTAMDETSKVVQELKAELFKRKSSPDSQDLCPIRQTDTVSKKFKGKHTQPGVSRSISNNRNFDEYSVSGFPASEHVECGSSALTEEPETEVLEMDQLEAELESELQKLSSCTTVTSLHEGITADFCEGTEFSNNGIHVQNVQNLMSNEFNGVAPYELDRKLSRLLIGQQESQIEELESELQSAHNKLNEKEAELQALKDCVRRLTQFSLSTNSDNEIEAKAEQENFSNNESTRRWHPMPMDEN